jgi:hypothetical protein
VHQVGYQPKLYYDARSTNHQAASCWCFYLAMLHLSISLVTNHLNSCIITYIENKQQPVKNIGIFIHSSGTSFHCAGNFDEIVVFSDFLRIDLVLWSKMWQWRGDSLGTAAPFCLLLSFQKCSCSTFLIRVRRR